MTLLVSMVCLAVRFPYGLGSVIWFGPYWFCWTLGCAVAELESSRIKLTIDSFKFIAWLSISALGFGLWLSEFLSVRVFLRRMLLGTLDPKMPDGTRCRCALFTAHLNGKPWNH